MTRAGSVLRGVAVALGLACLSGLARAQPTGLPEARTDGGAVSGVRMEGVDRFLGVPYAAAPVGELRWRPPEPVKPWVGVRKAERFGGTCPQSPRGVFASPSVSEDCLYLNVYAPADVVKRRLPVMVWFYGGGLFSGESDDYDGSALARAGVVVVTLNYRIGALGFLSHPALDAEGHPFANYGIMDQQAALKWVRRNIAAFRGDPGNVTIFGQSGGGTSVMAQLVSPTAAGLFQRAINQSGTHVEQIPPAKALEAGRTFAAKAGCAGQDASCLRALSVEQVLKAQGPMIPLVAAGFPTADGTVITASPFEAFGSGRFNRVPILTGLVGDEQAFFLDELNGASPLTAEGFAHYLQSFGAEDAPALQAAYPLTAYASPSLAEIAAAEGYKACMARTLDRMWSRRVPVYAYQFDDRTAPSYFGSVSYPMGAYHTAELQFLFPGFHGGQGSAHSLVPAEQALSRRMIAAWTSFARTGRLGAPWIAYSRDRDAILSLDIGQPHLLAPYAKEYHCDLWGKAIGAHRGAG
ncbi:carboxylesterase/lipase family protein [Caulobacter sp. S45]|uniref:carboxylesterase/lipase family protein n=1 Tax=Caulobacter sp. S45 TaxID=1641861 RepID=UPI00131D948F|nr:carboxylesterase family protein [Caulobacter sp. S45]